MPRVPLLFPGCTVYNSTTGIVLNDGGTAKGNVVYADSTGIQVGDSGWPYYSATATNNRVYDNSYGILAYNYSQVLGNNVYSNGLGIEADANGDAMSVTNNVVYANASNGIVVTSGNGTVVENNTVYQRSGSALVVQGGSQNTQIENNILWADTESGAGYAIYVASDSQQGFTSDYNDLYATGSGEVGPGRHFVPGLSVAGRHAPGSGQHLGRSLVRHASPDRRAGRVRRLRPRRPPRRLPRIKPLRFLAGGQIAPAIRYQHRNPTSGLPIWLSGTWTYDPNQQDPTTPSPLTAATQNIVRQGTAAQQRLHEHRAGTETRVRRRKALPIMC